jgi:hypothetical protein
VNGIELLVDETLALLAQEREIIEARVWFWVRDRVRGDIRVDGGDDLIGLGELEEGVVEPDLDLGEVERVIAQLDGLAAQVVGDAVAVAVEGKDGRLGDLASSAVEEGLAEFLGVGGAGGGRRVLAEVRGLPQRNLAVETLRKLLEGEIRARSQKNVVQARSFAEMLEQAIRRYQNRAIEAAAVIEELITLAQEMREADKRGEQLGLSEEEIAFYDALEVNDSAVKILGDETLRTIAQELVQAVRNSVTIDWTLRENVRAKIRVMIKRILRRYGYPPDKQEKATQTVLEQAEVLCREWVSV